MNPVQKFIVDNAMILLIIAERSLPVEQGHGKLHKQKLLQRKPCHLIRCQIRLKYKRSDLILALRRERILCKKIAVLDIQNIQAGNRRPGQILMCLLLRIHRILMLLRLLLFQNSLLLCSTALSAKQISKSHNIMSFLWSSHPKAFPHFPVSRQAPGTAAFHAKPRSKYTLAGILTQEAGGSPVIFLTSQSVQTISFSGSDNR